MMKTSKMFIKLGMIYATAFLFMFTSCSKNYVVNPTGDVDGTDAVFYALTSDNKLLTINAQNIATAVATATITGLQTSETIVGIDFRPATGQLYGLGSTSRLYVINTTTGAASAIGTAPFTPSITASSNGAGFDFNPTVDRIRYVGFNGQNLRLNPETGTVAATDGAINGATTPGIGAVAYTQNRAGAATTVLYDIDVNNDKLYKQDPPNDGKLVEVGSLSVNADATGGFDISPDGTKAFAVLTVAGKQGLFNIDLTTGKATRVKGDLPGTVIAIALPTEPVSYAVSSANELVIFNPASPIPVLKPITGMQAGEAILGIDMRPVNGQLYALGSTSRLYTLNASSGLATQVGTGTLTNPLLGTSFGFDFNPTVDRIRVVSNLGQNLRLNPNDGSVAAVDGNLSPLTSPISGAAYTNNFAGATATVLYDIDAVNGRLVEQDPPNAGTLVDVGALGVMPSAANGFDIGSTSGIAYALLTVGGTTKIYTINLTNGAATAGATLPLSVTGFTIGLGF
ncbi:hypothetical protein A0256_13830 [Mucilaginibacter sp. PAMC 26640]|nr:hypothetical protein A0256_13830 [Mucilaginibacter sp. PAMC 26640]